MFAMSFGVVGWILLIALLLVGAGWWYGKKADRFIEKKRPGQ